MPRAPFDVGVTMITRLPPGTFFGQSRGRVEVDGLTFSESAYAAGFDIPTHAHAHAFFYFVVEGACEETCRRRTNSYGPSTLVFHPSGEPHANRSPGEYVRRLRVEIACQRLASSDMPLAEIALAAGFSDQSHFTKTFRHYNGMTPGEYRRRLRSR